MINREFFQEALRLRKRVVELEDAIRRAEEEYRRLHPVPARPEISRREQMNLKVRPGWKQHLADIARDDHRSMIEVLELGLALYERNRGNGK